MHAEIMNAPSAKASIRYSGQCFRRASIAFVCTPVNAGLPRNIPENRRNKSGRAADLCDEMKKPTGRSRNSVLIEMNVRWLRQALALLDRLDDEVYTTSPRGFAPHRAGGHLRHILEFYQCFLNGLDSLHIDYDTRPRNAAIEESRDAASAAIRSIIGALEFSPAVRADCIVWVRMEDADATGVRDTFMESSIGRELQVLSSHTIHHFALIAMTLRMHGVAMDPDYGMAPSTLRQIASKEAA
jgi:hypothetical protein